MMSQKSYNVDTDHPIWQMKKPSLSEVKGFDQGYTDSWTVFELKKHIFTMSNLTAFVMYVIN